MSILGPLLFAALMIIPGWLMSLENKEMRTIAVVEYSTANKPVPDSLMLFKDVIPETAYLRFTYLPSTRLETLRHNFEESGYYAVLFIPQNITYAHQAKLYSTKQPGLEVKNHIESAIEKYLYNLNLRKYDISLDVINNAQTNITVQTIKWTDEGEKRSSTGLSMVVGYAGGFLIYILIFAFGAQVMRGIVDEKTNRIVEVIITSVKPFQLMSGKIIGIALVGLTQILLWFVLTFGIVQGIESYVYNQKIPDVEQLKPQDILSTEMGGVSKNAPQEQAKQELPSNIAGLDDILVKIKSLNYTKILITFFFFFLGGYLLYAAMFAAIGSAIDTETDTQQFMLPITIPLIFALITMGYVLNTPESGLSFWLSIIPFTSPIVMMARIPFEIPVWQVLLSGIILYLTFILMTALSAKIYRTGILMYGKKVSYKELWKWLFYRR
jgi:ABC-2 type transport system permease protein